ncbi:hypothetical protein [Acanthopleuribacter pedis]|uniref:Uncharacterized protein n=1 Tax=Acanthopleuribacter pedis TaxID=442870 RepID=A0A8J7Q6A4_9BACT|nr:hypothetical protein [Acanthopleuribacter pedis]MBO1317464.1 hypothetical protein [Acanthopleuribacter pedis]
MNWRGMFWLVWWLTAWGCLLHAQENPDELPPQQERRWQLGMWADLLFLDNDREGNEAFFKPAHLSFYAKYRWNDKLSFFGEVAGTREPDIGGVYESDANLERLYLQYEWRDEFNLRLGKIDNQMGIVKPIHWLVTLDTIRRPILEDNSYLPAKITGLELFGKFYLRDHRLAYSFSLSDSNNEIVDDSPIVRAKGAGLDVSIAKSRLYRAGTAVVFYRDPRDKDRNVTGVLPYVEWWVLPGRLLSRSEFLNMRLETANRDHIQAFYTKLKWQFNKRSYLNLRYDRGDDQRSVAGRERTAGTVTLGTRIGNRWRLRVEGSTNRIEDEARFAEWSAWAGWLF